MATKFCDPSAGGSNNGSSWENAYTSFQAAIDACSASDEVWVKARTITLTDPIDYDNANNPKIYGGFDTGLTGTDGSVAGRAAGTRTTLSGGTTVKQGNLSRTCTIDGFVFSGSAAVFGGLQANYATGTWTIKNCIFTSLRDDYRGGAILLTTGTLDIDNCEFNHNGTTAIYYGGAICMVAGTITCDNTIFHGNTVIYSGSAYYQSNGTSTFTNCNFNGNSVSTSTYGEGGACHITAGSASFVNCKIIDNTTPSGGSNFGGAVCFGGTTGKMVNCVVTGNSAYSGGGIRNSAGTTTITNCIICDNTAVNGGTVGGVRNAATLYVYNSIIRGNSGTEIDGGTVQYSNVHGGYTGTGNVDDDPHFVGSGNDPYNYGTTTSQSIDSGNAGATNYPTTDILGQARVDYSTVTNNGAGSPAYSDMGAYEMQEAAAPTAKKSLLLAFN